MRVGLIGEKLGHSFSKPIHEQLTGEEYSLFPLSREEFPRFMERRDFDGINVTIPYKQDVIPFCAMVDQRARRIGAVNTIVNQNGILHGYNTDYDGFAELLAANRMDPAGKRALVLGCGGTSRTVRAVLSDLGAASVRVVSRHPQGDELSYPQALEQKDTQLIVNTTPAGMFPAVEEQPIDLSGFPRLEAVADVIYNPLRTRLLQQAESLGIPCANGLLMLVSQARAAAERFRGISIPRERGMEVCRALLEDKRNLVLIGMPMSGKSTLGKQLASRLGRKFLDTDEWIVSQEGMGIPEIFQKYGEPGFREREHRAVRELSLKNGLVLATGGGAVLDPENVRNLRMNGLLLFIDRPLELLTVGKGRPLAKSPQEVEALYWQRYPIYQAACDRRIPNDAPPEQVLERLLSAGSVR